MVLNNFYPSTKRKDKSGKQNRAMGKGLGALIGTAKFITDKQMAVSTPQLYLTYCLN